MNRVGGNMRPIRPTSTLPRLVGLVAVPAMVSLLLFTSPARADDTAVEGTGGAVGLLSSADILTEGATTGGPQTTAEEAEQPRDLPVRPIVGLVMGVMIIAAGLIVAKRRGDRGRPS